MDRKLAAHKIRGIAARRGSALIAVMMVVAMLMAIVLATSFFEGNSRREALNEEANLRFREGMRFALGQAIANITIPPDLTVTAAVTKTAGGTELATDYGAKIFDRDKLPDITTGSNATMPATTVLQLKPQTSLGGLRVFGSNTYQAVFSTVPGYAAYAPQGSVNITTLSGWCNPHTGDTRAATLAFSGQLAMVAARKDATVANATFGEAHVLEGAATIQQGQGAGYKDAQLPLPDYAKTLKSQAVQARSQLRDSTTGNDKTNMFYGTPIGPETVIGFFTDFTGTLEGRYSMNASQTFFLPTVPTIATNPPYLYQILFHVPYPPDNATYLDASAAGDTAVLKAAAMVAANVAALGAQANFIAAQVAFTATPLPPQAAQLAEAAAIYTAAQATVTALNVYVTQTSASFADVAQKALAGSLGVPETRAVENPLGNVGWCFNGAQVLLGKCGTLALHPDLQSVLNLFGNAYVKLVHFGQRTRTWNWAFSSSALSLDATLTVPRGRTLKISNPSITINGDLWIGRGAVFYADTQKLTILPGRANDGSASAPKGRIFLEEGASLVVEGDLVCKGDSRLGSVVTCGLPDKVHPITASIFARNVTLDNGIYSGTAMDDFLAGMPDSEVQKTGTDTVRPLLDETNPARAKLDGPFHARAPYFAKWATSVMIFFPPMAPVGEPSPTPVIFPIPLPNSNLMNYVAQAFSMLFEVNLNLALGENFTTSTDWWQLGENSSPIFTNIETSKASSIRSFGTPQRDKMRSKSIVETFVVAIVQKMMTTVLNEVIEKLITTCATSAVPYTSLITTVADGVLSITTAIAVRTKDLHDKQEAFRDLDTTLSGMAQAGRTLAGLQNTTEPDVFMKDYSGVFVNADEAITISGTVASGMFVAGRRLSMQADHCVGTLLCHDGNIDCKNLLYFPFFNQCSSYVPKKTDSTLVWIDSMKNTDYAADCASDTCINVGPPPLTKILTAQGWTQ